MNATWIFLAELSGRALNLVLLILLARWLGRGGLGLYTFAYLVAESVLAMVGFGFDSLVVRDLSRRPALAGRYLVHMLVSRLVFLVPAGFVGALVFINKEGGKAELGLFLLVLAAAFVHQQILLLGAFARARQEMWREALTRLALSLLALAGGATALWLGWGVKGVVGARLGAALLAGVPALCIAFRLFQLRLPGFSFVRARRLWVGAAPLAMFFLAVQLYGALPGIFLGLEVGDEAVGLYGGGWRLFMLALMAAGALAGSFLPHLARTIGKGEVEFRAELARGCRLMLFAALPLTAGCLVSGGRALVYLLGAEFALSGPVLTVLAVVLVPDFINHLLAVGLIARGQSGRALFAALCGVVATIVSSLLLVNAFGVQGAAWAFVSGRLTVFAVQGIFMFRWLKPVAMGVVLLRGGIAAGATGLLFWKAGLWAGSLWVEALTWPLVYIGFLFLVGGWRREGEG